MSVCRRITYQEWLDFPEPKPQGYLPDPSDTSGNPPVECITPCCNCVLESTVMQLSGPTCCSDHQGDGAPRQCRDNGPGVPSRCLCPSQHYEEAGPPQCSVEGVPTPCCKPFQTIVCKFSDDCENGCPIGWTNFYDPPESTGNPPDWYLTLSGGQCNDATCYCGYVGGTVWTGALACGGPDICPKCTCTYRTQDGNISTQERLRCDSPCPGCEGNLNLSSFSGQSSAQLAHDLVQGNKDVWGERGQYVSMQCGGTGEQWEIACACIYSGSSTDAELWGCPNGSSCTKSSGNLCSLSPLNGCPYDNLCNTTPEAYFIGRNESAPVPATLVCCSDLGFSWGFSQAFLNEQDWSQTWCPGFQSYGNCGNIPVNEYNKCQYLMSIYGPTESGDYCDRIELYVNNSYDVTTLNCP